MRLIHLLCFCSSLATLMAYPADYNETSATIARDALSNLRSSIALNRFPSQLETYNDKILSLIEKTYEEMDSMHNELIQRLIEVQESAEDVDVAITECLEKYPVITSEKYYESFNEDCAIPASDFGSNLKALGEQKNWGIFASKYEELMHSFSGCLSPGDPAPYICEGVIAATLQEVERILPLVIAHSEQIQREFDQQILVMSKCSSEHISVLSSRLQIQFTNVKTCVLNQINTA